MVDARAEARRHTRETGADIPEVTDWAWPPAA
jgi:phosphoketolase